MKFRLNIAIFGATGYTGIELIRLLKFHKKVDIKSLNWFDNLLLHFTIEILFNYNLIMTKHLTRLALIIAGIGFTSVWKKNSDSVIIEENLNIQVILKIEFG